MIDQMWKHQDRFSLGVFLFAHCKTKTFEILNR